MDTVRERALVKAMVKVMSIETEMHDIHKMFYEAHHEVTILEGLQRDLDTWKLIFKLVNESKDNSK
jgi:hypothetical protein